MIFKNNLIVNINILKVIVSYIKEYLFVWMLKWKIYYRLDFNGFEVCLDIYYYLYRLRVKKKVC